MNHALDCPALNEPAEMSREKWYHSPRLMQVGTATAIQGVYGGDHYDGPSSSYWYYPD